jgi:hypothetical protein
MLRAAAVRDPGQGFGPNRMKLIPAMIGVKDPRASQADARPHRWSGQVPTIARHELHNKISTLLGPVHRIDQQATSIEVDVHIPVLLMAHGHDRSRDLPAWGQNM